MTMKKLRTIPAGKFKAECLALLDRVSENRETYVVTKHGRPVAQLVPLSDPEPQPLRGSVVVRGDIVGPILDRWEMDE